MLQSLIPCRVYTLQDPSRSLKRRSVHEPQHFLNVRPGKQTGYACRSIACRLADQFCIVVQFPGGVLCCAMAETEKDADVPVTKTPKETRHCSCNCVSMWEADA